MLTRWSRDAEPGDPLHLPIETVVRKLTKNNAALYGFPDRGQLAVGLRADLNLIELNKLVAHVPHLTYELPANMPRLSQQVEGYVSSLVHGEVVQERGVLSGARPGRVLRSRAKSKINMLTVYTCGGPNPRKVTILLEELHWQYAWKLVDLYQGQNRSPEYLAVNPN